MTINLLKHKMTMEVEFVTSASYTSAVEQFKEYVAKASQLPFVHEPIKLIKITHVDTELKEV